MKKLNTTYPKRKRQSILAQLLKIAIPAIGASILTLTNNIIDIGYIARIGSDAVAAVGSAGFYIHLGWALSSIITVGAGIKVSHAVGEEKPEKIIRIIQTSIYAIVLAALIYTLVTLIGRGPLIAFFNLTPSAVAHSASQYLLIVGAGFVFMFFNYLATSLFVGYGNSKLPFYINASGLVINMVLDPLLIFTFDMGVQGAAWATLVSGLSTSLLFYIQLQKHFGTQVIRLSLSKKHLEQIYKLGLGPAFQRIVFTLVAISLARMISQWGNTAIAVQKMGVQIEALSIMVVAGFSTAISTLSGQAYGAKDYTLQWRIYLTGLPVVILLGLFTTLLYTGFSEQLFAILINDQASIKMGGDYLRIIGYSQVFMAIEFISSGAFYGWGRTNIPAVTSMILTSLRIPMAFMLFRMHSMQVSSVWWSISLSSIAKGVIISALLIYLLRTFIQTKRHEAKYN